MRKIYLYLLAFISLFSCAEKASDTIYQGKLEELIVGDFSLMKDSLTKRIEINQILMIDNIEYLVSRDLQNVKIYSLESGQVIHDYQLTLDGPYAFDDYVALFHANSKDEIAILNTQGMFYYYDKKVLVKKFLINSETAHLSSISPESTLFRLKNGAYKTVISPLSHFFTKDEEVIKNSLKKLVLVIDPKNKKINFYDIVYPFGYLEKFSKDIGSYPPDLLYVDFEDMSYFTFPYSDSIFIYKDSLLVSKKFLESARNSNYGGTELVEKTFKGTNDKFSLYELKKESSATIDLLFDKKRNFFLLIRKQNETGTGESKDSRTKNYSFSFYNRDFDSLGEYDFSYPPNFDLENWFITSEGLFINKPEQKSEDEYEFYKIDLSRLAD